MRRRIVLTAFGGYAFVLLVNLLHGLDGVPEGLWKGLAGLGLVLTMLGAIPLMSPSRIGLPEGRDRDMDERQWQRLSQAHIRAYRVLGLVLLLGGLYLQIAHRWHLPLPTPHFNWLTLWPGAALLIPALPTAILAWTEPDVNLQDEKPVTLDGVR